MKIVAVRGVPDRYLQDPHLDQYMPITAAARRPGMMGPPPVLDDAIIRANDQYMRGRTPYNSETQPRDRRGKFRQVLARLRFDLGGKQLQEIVKEIRAAEAADEIGDYTKSTESAAKVISMLDAVKDGTLDPKTIGNLRESARQLGKVLAYLPLPKGDATAKVRYSDLPPSTKKFVLDLVRRVTQKLEPDAAAKLLLVINSFQSGVRSMTNDQLLRELNRMMQVLN